VLDVVEAGGDVAFDDPIHLLLAWCCELMEMGQCGVTAALRAKAVAFGSEVALEDRFEDGFDHHLNQTICQRGNAQRASFSVCLGNEHPANGLMHVRPGFERRFQFGDDTVTVA
jgi:hypothetical protein